jgi:hypothetical protein
MKTGRTQFHWQIQIKFCTRPQSCLVFSVHGSTQIPTAVSTVLTVIVLAWHFLLCAVVSYMMWFTYSLCIIEELLTLQRCLNFIVPLNVFMTVQCTDAGSMWRIISPYSTPSLALRGEIRNKVTSYSVHYVLAVLQLVASYAILLHTVGEVYTVHFVFVFYLIEISVLDLCRIKRLFLLC